MQLRIYHAIALLIIHFINGCSGVNLPSSKSSKGGANLFQAESTATISANVSTTATTDICTCTYEEILGFRVYSFKDANGKIMGVSQPADKNSSAKEICRELFNNSVKETDPKRTCKSFANSPAPIFLAVDCKKGVTVSASLVPDFSPGHLDEPLEASGVEMLGKGSNVIRIDALSCDTTEIMKYIRNVIDHIKATCEKVSLPIPPINIAVSSHGASSCELQQAFALNDKRKEEQLPMFAVVTDKGELSYDEDDIVDNSQYLMCIPLKKVGNDNIYDNDAIRTILATSLFDKIAAEFKNLGISFTGINDSCYAGNVIAQATDRLPNALFNLLTADITGFFQGAYNSLGPNYPVYGAPFGVATASSLFNDSWKYHDKICELVAHQGNIITHSDQLAWILSQIDKEDGSRLMGLPPEWFIEVESKLTSLDELVHQNCAQSVASGAVKIDKKEKKIVKKLYVGPHFPIWIPSHMLNQPARICKTPEAPPPRVHYEADVCNVPDAPASTQTEVGLKLLDFTPAVDPVEKVCDFQKAGSTCDFDGSTIPGVCKITNPDSKARIRCRCEASAVVSPQQGFSPAPSTSATSAKSE